MRLSSRRVDDADVIRARLRVLLSEGHRSGGWLPEDLPDDDSLDQPSRPRLPDSDRAAGPSEVSEPEVHGIGALPAGIGRHRSPGPAVRVAPGRPGVRALLVAGLAGALLLVGWTWVGQPRAEPVDARPVAGTGAPASSSAGTAAQTVPTVTVSVVGQVVRPGLVVLPGGSRVADALAAAGGVASGVDPAAAVNLAAVVTDGQQIAVGVPAAGSGPGVTTPAAAGRVALNSATVADLDALPGIGPVLAQRIVDHRAQNGPFAAVEELEDVPGIGPATFDELVDLVAV